MSYLVTGATGFIGTNIVEQLLHGGDSVVALSNVAPLPRQQRLAEKGDVVFLRGDVRDQAGLEAIIESHHVRRVIHAAVITSNAERERKSGPLIVDVNLVGAAAAATAAANKGVERFVLVGSAGVFSAHDLPDGMLVEESQPQRVDTLYGIGKSAAEVIVARICALNRLSYVIGRVATAFGPWEHDSGYRDTLSPNSAAHSEGAGRRGRRAAAGQEEQLALWPRRRSRALNARASRERAALSRLQPRAVIGLAAQRMVPAPG